MVASDYKHVGLSECEVMDDTWYVCQVSPYFCTNLAFLLDAHGVLCIYVDSWRSNGTKIIVAAKSSCSECFSTNAIIIMRFIDYCFSTAPPPQTGGVADPAYLCWPSSASAALPGVI